MKLISQCSDEAFACEGLGKGIVLYPSDGEVHAPCDGVVTALFPTKHAIGILSENGCEVLIHIGINTVELNGEHFDLLVKFDKKAVEEKGFSTEIPVIISNTNDYEEVLCLKEGQIHSQEPVLEVK